MFMDVRGKIRSPALFFQRSELKHQLGLRSPGDDLTGGGVAGLPGRTSTHWLISITYLHLLLLPCDDTGKIGYLSTCFFFKRWYGALFSHVYYFLYVWYMTVFGSVIRVTIIFSVSSHF